jgi:hypothetical protein
MILVTNPKAKNICGECGQVGAECGCFKDFSQRLKDIINKSRIHWDEIGQPYPAHLRSVIRQIESRDSKPNQEHAARHPDRPDYSDFNIPDSAMCCQYCREPWPKRDHFDDQMMCKKRASDDTDDNH